MINFNKTRKNNIKNFKINIILLFLLVSPLFCMAQNKNIVLKASFIRKFAEFTNWPKEIDTTDTFVICVIGKTSLTKVFKKVYKNFNIKGKNVEIINVTSIDQIKSPQILYISESKKHQLPEILSKIKGKPILTISSSTGFAKKGVHINFYITKNGTLHFEINHQKTKESNLRINLMLLEIAKIID